jgi:hypothetical protein
MRKKIVLMMKAILGPIFVFAILLMIYYWIFCDAATARKTATFFASLATIIGVVWAIISVTNALQAYKSDRSMRKKEIINKLYERFLEDGLYELYEKIKTNQPFELSPKNKQALNKALTLFDEIEYFKAEKLFDEKLWEYIGCEIVNLSCHKDVQRFLRETEEQYPKPKNQSQKDMMPFTGFKELVKELPDPYWFKKKPNLEEDVEG